MDPHKRANFRGDLSKGVCSPNRWNITHLWLCVYFSFPFLFSSRRLQQNGWTYTHDLGLYIKQRRFTQPAKDVPFGGFDDKNTVHSVQGIKTPKNTRKSGRG